MHVRPVLCPRCDYLFVVNADHDRTCIECGGPLPTVPRGAYCGPRCYMRAYRRRQAEKPLIARLPCKIPARRKR